MFLKLLLVEKKTYNLKVSQILIVAVGSHLIETNFSHLLSKLQTVTLRDVAAAPQTPQLGGPRPTLGAQVSLKLLFGYVTIFSSADLFTTDLNCRKKLACDIISECNVILSRRI